MKKIKEVTVKKKMGVKKVKFGVNWRGKNETCLRNSGKNGGESLSRKLLCFTVKKKKTLPKSVTLSVKTLGSAVVMFWLLSLQQLYYSYILIAKGPLDSSIFFVFIYKAPNIDLYNTTMTDFYLLERIGFAFCPRGRSRIT